MQIDITSLTANHKSLHLEEAQLEPSTPQCPFCKSLSRKRVNSLQENPKIVLLQCNDCHAVSASRMPTDTALSDYYGKYYQPTPSQKMVEEDITFDGPLRLAKNMSHISLRYQKNTSVNILDFGGGDGTISHLLAMQLLEQGAQHINITVIDYSKKTVHPDDKRIVINRLDSIDDVDGLYGFIIASAVIEHFPKPEALLQKLLKLLDHDGIFYARTPYVIPLMKLVQFIGIKLDFTYPAHLHDLGQTFWEKYFLNESSGKFTILKSRPSIIQTTLRKHFMRTVLACLLKAPWYLFRKSYKYVGGWEVFVQKR